ncbi:Potassium inwardly-rectifying channel, subfamily J, member [Seminavis robusta]|uniref:Potassium inwardly-rectifying channel, subfamily J, member n=1 Tax=Seminavis robusta TaxID=568900 RepID=A0A9N8HDA0_9STRA|nr:Potassium inwardly-rectifying channel, subfamily J, member [Seminavis robusta]|eukprot:Sro417_g138700.1 Potassium inwardly-rectifying channel, subfamily J, member (893) ;mRNA; f:31930-34725
MVSSTSPNSRPAVPGEPPEEPEPDMLVRLPSNSEPPTIMTGESRDTGGLNNTGTIRSRSNVAANGTSGGRTDSEPVFKGKPRLIKRDRPNYQSRSRVQVRSQDWSAQLWKFISRLLSCQRRSGVHVLFSNRAIVGYRKDVRTPCFQIRVYETGTRHPVVQASCTMYVVTQKSPVPMPLRIIVPAEDIGSLLFLSLPSEVVHAIDADSALTPDPRVVPAMDKPQGPVNTKSTLEEEEDMYCPVCGEPFETINNMIQHGKYQDMVESHEDFPYVGSHQEVDWDEWEKTMTESRSWSLPQLKQYFEANISEVICIVEGIDPVTRGTFHAVQSYQLEDIYFGEGLFADCVYVTGPQNRDLAVDMSCFHHIDELSERDQEVVFEKFSNDGDDNDPGPPTKKLFTGHSDRGSVGPSKQESGILAQRATVSRPILVDEPTDRAVEVVQAEPTNPEEAPSQAAPIQSEDSPDAAKPEEAQSQAAELQTGDSPEEEAAQSQTADSPEAAKHEEAPSQAAQSQTGDSPEAPDKESSSQTEPSLAPTTPEPTSEERSSQTDPSQLPPEPVDEEDSGPQPWWKQPLVDGWVSYSGRFTAPLTAVLEEPVKETTEVPTATPDPPAVETTTTQAPASEASSIDPGSETPELETAVTDSATQTNTSSIQRLVVKDVATQTMFQKEASTQTTFSEPKIIFSSTSSEDHIALPTISQPVITTKSTPTTTTSRKATQAKKKSTLPTPRPQGRVFPRSSSVPIIDSSGLPSKSSTAAITPAEKKLQLRVARQLKQGEAPTSGKQAPPPLLTLEADVAKQLSRKSRRRASAPVVVVKDGSSGPARRSSAPIQLTPPRQGRQSAFRPISQDEEPRPASPPPPPRLKKVRRDKEHPDWKIHESHDRKTCHLSSR